MSLNLLGQLNTFFFTPTKSFKDKNNVIWLSASLCLSLLYPILALSTVWGESYWIQDDARQHIFWMQKFVDPEIFNNDLIAKYYESISPWGIHLFYKFSFLLIKIEPLFLSKIIPTFLSVVTAFFAYKFAQKILPLPFYGFVASVMLIQNFWMQDGFASATGRAFGLPILIAFFGYLVEQSYWKVGFTILLMGLFYPPFILIFIVILLLQLIDFKASFFKPSINKQKLIFVAINIIVCVISLSPQILISSEFNQVITLQQAKQLPSFLPGGRTVFFDSDSFHFWFNGDRTGLRLSAALMPDFTYATFLFPFLWISRNFFINKFSGRNLTILFQISIAGILLFFAAHLLLFELYLPSRYPFHTLRITFTFVSAYIVVFLLQELFLRLQKTKWQATNFVMSTVLSFCLIMIIVKPLFLEWFPTHGYVIGQYPLSYDFLKTTPKDTLIASLDGEIDNIATFSYRSVYTAREYAIPYHFDYYQILQKRTRNLIAAHYTTDTNQLKRFIRQSGVDLWLVSDRLFSATYLRGDGRQNRWLQEFQPQTDQAIASLETSSQKTALQQVQEQCTVFTERDIKLIDSQCILRAEPKK
ncbi:MAG: hypothetical protein WBB82_16015 [Limnothrix sp.]